MFLINKTPGSITIVFFEENITLILFFTFKVLVYACVKNRLVVVYANANCVTNLALLFACPDKYSFKCWSHKTQPIMTSIYFALSFWLKTMFNFPIPRRKGDALICKNHHHNPFHNFKDGDKVDSHSHESPYTSGNNNVRHLLKKNNDRHESQP